jgi:MFS family permease
MSEESPPHTRATPDPQAETSVDVEAAGTRRSAIRRTFLSMALDTAPFRASRDFRLLFFGQGISTAGTMITYVAIPFQTYELTRSSLVVGLISFSELVAILLMALVGGALADAMDRRLMVRLAELGLCLSVGALVVNSSLRHPQLWVLFVVVIVAAGLDAVRRPSLDAIVSESRQRYSPNWHAPKPR